MPRNGMRPGRALLAWAGRAAMLLSGVTLAVRLGVPAPIAGAPELQRDQGDAGRGRPATPPSRQSRQDGHETEDMDGRLMGRLIALLFTVALVVIGGIIGLRTLVHSAYEGAQPNYTAEQRSPVTPPAPNLQADPLAELARLRAAEAKLLGSYGWTDDAHTRARIPIDRARALILGQPLDTPP